MGGCMHEGKPPPMSASEARAHNDQKIGHARVCEAYRLFLYVTQPTADPSTPFGRAFDSWQQLYAARCGDDVVSFNGSGRAWLVFRLKACRSVMLTLLDAQDHPVAVQPAAMLRSSYQQYCGRLTHE